jgi:hypothetical protein
MSSLARKSRTVGSPAQGEHSTMLNDPADLDERSLRREVEALSLHLVNLYGSSLTPDMKVCSEFSCTCQQSKVFIIIGAD